MGKVCIFITCFIFVCSILQTSPCAAQDDCASLLNQGAKEFEQAHYHRAMTMFDKALSSGANCSSNQMISLYVYKAKAHLVFNEENEAVTQMKHALMVNPSLALDPANNSPKVIGILNQARDELNRKVGIEDEEKDENSNDNKSFSYHQQPEFTPMAKRKIAAWSLFGAGSTCVIGSGIALGLAYSEDSKQKDAAARNDEEGRNEHWKNTNTYATSSAILAGTAAVAYGSAFYLMWKSGQGKSVGRTNEVFRVNALTPYATGDSYGIVFELNF